MITTILTYAAVFAVGAVTGIFFYRNNEKDIDPIADKVDKVHDTVKREVKKKTAKK